MKRFIVLVSVAALASFALFGCASSESGDNSSSGASEAQSSSAAQADGSEADSSSQAASSDSSTNDSDLHGIAGPVSQPPIACTKKASLENVSIMVPENWTAEVGIGGYLKIVSDDGLIAGSLSIDTETKFDESKTDEEFSEFIKSTLDQAKANGFELEEGFTVEQNGDLLYMISPFSAKKPDETGKEQEYWGYSYCGYDNELILFDLSCEQDDKDVLATFRWILENLKVD